MSSEAEKALKREADLLARLESQCAGDCPPHVKHCAELTRQIVKLMWERLRLNEEYRRS